MAVVQVRRADVDATLARQPDQVGGGVDPLRGLLVSHPLEEPVTGLLMEALATCGRPAEALTCYAQTRQRLGETLGTDRCPDS
jgi:hypothetical protein